MTLISLLRKAVRPVHQLKSGKRMTSHQFSTTNADCTDLKKKSGTDYSRRLNLKRRGHFVGQNQWPHQMQPAPMAAANLQFRQTNINKFGLCFKISNRDYACLFVFKLKSEMFSLNNATFSNFVGLLLDLFA